MSADCEASWLFRRLPLLLLGIDLLLAFAYLFDVWIGAPVWTITRLLDLDGEANLTSWYSSSKLLCIALVWAGIAALRKEPGGSRMLALVVPLGFLALSIDEAAQLHEFIGEKSDLLLSGGTRANSLFPRTGIWMFVLGLPAGAASCWLLRLARRQQPYAQLARGKCLAGMGLFLASAAGLEILSNFLDPGTPAAKLQVTGEELGEMLGVTLCFWGSCETFLHQQGSERTAKAAAAAA